MPKNKRSVKKSKSRKQKQSQPARRTTVVVSRSIKTRGPRLGPGTHAYARSLRDPFTESACIPDGSRGTSCFSVRQNGTLTTGTAGSCYGIAVSLQPDGLYAIDTGSIVPTTVIPANWSVPTGITTIAAMYKSYRPVSAGLKISYIGTTMNDSGVIACGTLPPEAALSNYNASTMQTLTAASNNYKTYPLRQGCYLTWRPQSVDDTDTWHLLQTTPKASTAVMQYPLLFAWVFGAAISGSSSVQFEFIVNYEGVNQLQSIVPGGISQSGSSKTEPEIGWYEGAQSLIERVPNIMPFIGNPSAIIGMGVGTMASSLVGGALRRVGNRAQPLFRNEL